MRSICFVRADGGVVKNQLLPVCERNEERGVDELCEFKF